MKHISTILSVIALAAAGVLFFMYAHQAGELKKVSSDARKTSPSEFRIAYFDMDTLEAHYDYYKDAQNVTKAKEDAINSELAGMENSYQKKIQEWRQKGNAMTQAQSEQAQQEYGAMQQNLQSRKDALQQELYKKTEDLKTSIRKSIEDYVKEYNKQRTYSFIFAYDPSSYIYYKDTVYNITSDLLQGLNAAYKKKD